MKYKQEPPSVNFFEDFTVGVNQDGYCWSNEPLDAKAQNNLRSILNTYNYERDCLPPYLRPKTLGKQILINPLEMLEYEKRKPFPQPLFLEFSSLDMTCESYSNFASRYGNLIVSNFRTMDNIIEGFWINTPYDFWLKEQLILKKNCSLMAISKS